MKLMIVLHPYIMILSIYFKIINLINHSFSVKQRILQEPTCILAYNSDLIELIPKKFLRFCFLLCSVQCISKNTGHFIKLLDDAEMLRKQFGSNIDSFLVYVSFFYFQAFIDFTYIFIWEHLFYYLVLCLRAFFLCSACLESLL